MSNAHTVWLDQVADRMSSDHYTEAQHDAAMDRLLNDLASHPPSAIGTRRVAMSAKLHGATVRRGVGENGALCHRQPKRH